MKNMKICVLLSGLLLLSCLPVYGEVVLNGTTFPDSTFREYVKSFDIDKNNLLSNEELEAVTAIYIGGYTEVDYDRDMSTGMFIPVYTSKYNVKSLKGVEYFTNLQILDCSFNALDSIDVSKFPLLVYLNCAGNQIKTLNLTSNPALKVLWCCRNQLSSLNVSKNKELEALYCWNNNLSELNVNENENLSVLFCSDNRLTKLDVSNNTKLWSLSCGRNSIKQLMINKNPRLIELYAFRNKLITIDTKDNSLLSRLSLTKNDLGLVNISSNNALKAFDCGSNYLARLDTASNTELEELYCYETTIGNIDLKHNTALISLDVSNTNLMTLDLSNNTLLQSLDCFGNCRLERLDITSSNEYHQTDLHKYVGENLSKVKSVQGYQYKYNEGDISELIETDYNPSTGIARFKNEPHVVEYNDPYFDSVHDVKELTNNNMPHYIEYEYDLGHTGTANSRISRVMKVKMSLPRNSFMYLPAPRPESGGVGEEDIASKVVSIDEIADFYPFMSAANVTLEETIPAKRDVPGENPSSESKTSSGGGGGCNSGQGAFTVAVVFFAGMFILCFGHKKLFIIASISIAGAGLFYAPLWADYALPIEDDIYTISGTWSSNFELTDELKDKIATEWENPGITENKLSTSGLEGNIVKYSEVALPGTWTVRPVDLYSLSANGEYGGVVLPIIENTSSNDVYVALCTFSDDVKPGELIAVHGFQVDISERESINDSEKFYLIKFVALDEDYKRVDSVPENRKVYIAVSLTPEYINSGIVSVVKGQYIAEEEPLYRLTPETVQNIASQLGISPNELKYLTRMNMGKPIPPTQEMQTYVKNDNHEIIADLPTVSVDEPGTYIIPITLSDDTWELVQDKDIADYKFYALNDSNLGDNQMQPAIINGLMNTFEIFSLSGKKLTKFGVKEFFMVGFLDAGKPFSLYLGKLLLSFLTGGLGGLIGGCNTGFFPFVITAVVVVGLKRYFNH